MAIAESLDHFVVPVDDLVVAEEFYVRVFGGVITKRNGLNVRQRKRGAVPHTFIQIGGKRMGVYLQSDHRPEPSGARGLPTYSFTTTAQGLVAARGGSQSTQCPIRRAGNATQTPSPTSRYFSPIRQAIIMPYSLQKMPRPGRTRRPAA